MEKSEKVTHPPFNHQTIDGLCDLMMQINNGEKLSHDRVYNIFYRVTSYKQESKPNNQGKTRKLQSPKLYKEVIRRLTQRGDLNAN